MTTQTAKKAHPIKIRKRVQAYNDMPLFKAMTEFPDLEDMLTAMTERAADHPGDDGFEPFRLVQLALAWLTWNPQIPFKERTHKMMLPHEWHAVSRWVYDRRGGELEERPTFAAELCDVLYCALADLRATEEHPQLQFGVRLKHWTELFEGER